MKLGTIAAAPLACSGLAAPVINSVILEQGVAKIIDSNAISGVNYD